MIYGAAGSCAWLLIKVTLLSWSPRPPVTLPRCFETTGAKLGTNNFIQYSDYIQSETRLIPPPASSLLVSVKRLRSWTTELHWCDWRWSLAQWKVLRRRESVTTKIQDRKDKMADMMKNTGIGLKWKQNQTEACCSFSLALEENFNNIVAIDSSINIFKAAT